MNLERLFSGEGGMDVTDAVDTRSGTAFVRRRDVLENENHIDEGIAIALHPVIPMRIGRATPDQASTSVRAQYTTLRRAREHVHRQWPECRNSLAH